MNPGGPQELKLVTSDTLVKTGLGYVWGVVLTTNGTGTLKIHDGTDATGTKKIEIDYQQIAAGQPVSIMFPSPIRFMVGIYVDVSGQSCSLLYE